MARRMESSLSSIQRIRQETGLPVRFGFFIFNFVAETFLWFGQAVDRRNSLATGRAHRLVRENQDLRISPAGTAEGCRDVILGAGK
jgi:hypothetical protein